MATRGIGGSKAICALAIFLTAFAPLHAQAAGDLHDLYGQVQGKGHAVTIPAALLARLKLASPNSDVSGKEIVVTETGGDRRGITAFELSGVPTLTMFHVEPNKDDSWLMRFSLDGEILNQEWEQGGYRTYEMHAPEVADSEIGFWRARVGK